MFALLVSAKILSNSQILEQWLIRSELVEPRLMPFLGPTISQSYKKSARVSLSSFSIADSQFEPLKAATSWPVLLSTMLIS